MTQRDSAKFSDSPRRHSIRKSQTPSLGNGRQGCTGASGRGVQGVDVERPSPSSCAGFKSLSRRTCSRTVDGRSATGFPRRQRSVAFVGIRFPLRVNRRSG